MYAFFLAAVGMVMGLCLNPILWGIARYAESIYHTGENESIADTDTKIATLQNQLKNDASEYNFFKLDAAEIKIKAAHLNQVWLMFRKAQPALVDSNDHAEPGKQKTRLRNIS